MIRFERAMAQPEDQARGSGTAADHQSQQELRALTTSDTITLEPDDMLPTVGALANLSIIQQAF